jgi:hypothetical protein
MKTSSTILTLFTLILVLGTSCVNDTVPEPVYPCDDLAVTPNYDNDIKSIIDTNCAFSGCHISGFNAGDFSNYQGMESYLPIRISEEVLGEKTMPPNGFTALTQEELILISCWLEAGHPEN